MPKTVGKVLKIGTTVLIALVVLLAILLVGVRVFGLQVYTVLSGSMEPEYPTGAVIYVTEVDPAALQVEDVITFRLNGAATVATHRIIEIIPGEDTAAGYVFRTKGDNNDIADELPVDPANVVGKPVFTIPYLGYFAAYVQQPPGTYVTITVAAALLLLSILSDVVTDEKKKPAEAEPKK